MRATLILLLLASPAFAEPLSFRLVFDEKSRAAPFTGRAYVMLTRNNPASLMPGVNWFKPEPFFAKDVRGVKPGDTIVIDDKALAHPTPLEKLPKATYTIQAVIDTRPGKASFSAAPGNLWGTARMMLDPATSGPVTIKLDRVVKEAPFAETEKIKLVDIESKLLKAFGSRPSRLRAAVILPESYSEKDDRRYPTYYEIPGFGGDHKDAPRYRRTGSTKRGGVEVIHVLLDPVCDHGHHTFADSANNGPVGRALIEELIPEIDKRFKTTGAKGRLVGGHSSGGWSSLWLQVSYPDSFDGCWSTAPDSMDFRDFQRCDLYEPKANLLFVGKGESRPIARRDGKVIVTFKPFSDMERVMGHGGQLASFEAVFSERGPDGEPKRLWDRDTGAVDAEVAKSWRKYDIRLKLANEWDKLGPKLKGKLHVYMGEEDTFYLEGATRLLKKQMEELKSDAKVDLFPKKHHGDLVDGALRERIGKEMAARLKAVGAIK